MDAHHKLSKMFVQTFNWKSRKIGNVGSMFIAAGYREKQAKINWVTSPGEYARHDKASVLSMA